MTDCERLPEEELEDAEERLFSVTEAGVRFDVFLSCAAELSRAQAQKLIENGDATVNNAPAKANRKLKQGDEVRLLVPPPEDLALVAENIPLCVVYEDSDMIVINKAQGMVVHPAPGNESGTLVNALLYHVHDLSGIGGVKRPGIVHRIDKLTSGLIVVAKNDMAHASLAAQIKAHTARRSYLALVEGNIKEDSGTIDAPIGRHPVDRKRMAVVPNGREAVTHFTVLLRLGDYTLIEARLETGRTHQIRVHMAYSKHPVAGDTVYGQKKPRLGLSGQALHAYRLQLTHPRTGEDMVFFAPVPEYFLAALKKAGWDGEAFLPPAVQTLL